MVKVSVIVPVYNIKNCIEKCVQSIRKQTYTNIEILLVNDGSTDGSDMICREHSKIDSRIKIIDKENGGLVSARKAGICHAAGDYILNVDGDDWIEEKMIEVLVSKAEKTNADIITSGYYREHSKSIAKITDSIDEGVYSTDEEKCYLYQHMIFNGKVEKRGIIPSIWNKLIRTDLLKEVYLYESNDMNIGEDAASVYSCCALADKIVVTHNVLYHYVVRLDSIMHTKDSCYLRNVNELYLFMRENFDKSKFKDILREQLDLLIMQYCIWGTNYMLDINPKFVIPYYNFPTKELSNGNRLVIYGAGRVGQSFYKQFIADENYRVVGWVDQKYKQYREKGFPVNSIDIIDSLEFDYIILAFKYKDMADQVKEILMSKFKIAETKIIWKEPINILDKYWINS